MLVARGTGVGVKERVTVVRGVTDCLATGRSTVTEGRGAVLTGATLIVRAGGGLETLTEGCGEGLGGGVNVAREGA